MAGTLVSPSGSYVFSCDQVVSSDVPASLFPPSPLCSVVTKAAAVVDVFVLEPTAVNVQQLMTQM